MQIISAGYSQVMDHFCRVSPGHGSFLQGIPRSWNISAGYPQVMDNFCRVSPGHGSFLQGIPRSWIISAGYPKVMDHFCRVSPRGDGALALLMVLKLTLPGLASPAALEGEEIGVVAIATEAEVGPPNGISLPGVQDELALRELHRS